MFCSKCGKQLADNSAFCTYCGSPTAGSSASVSAAAPSVSEQARSVSADASPVSEPISLTPPVSEALEQTGFDDGDTAYTGKIVEEAVSAPAYPFPPEERAEPPASFPAPVDPPKAGVSGAASSDTSDMRDAGAVITAAAVSAQAKETKYYTFGHIALCLAAVAVIAIVAGVFAGLYFSTF